VSNESDLNFGHDRGVLFSLRATSTSLLPLNVRPKTMLPSSRRPRRLPASFLAQIRQTLSKSAGPAAKGSAYQRSGRESMLPAQSFSRMLYGVLGWMSFGRTIAENDVQIFSTAHKKLDWALVYMHSVKAVLRSQK
jgi:hypothetical protein